MWVSGLPLSCSRCRALALSITSEQWDHVDKVVVGEAQCDACGTIMLFSRRLTPAEATVEQIHHLSIRQPQSEEPIPMASTTPKVKAKSQDLPGMEDRAIKALEDIAEAYAEVRDERIALNLREAELKQTAMALMKKHEKQIYRRNGIEIRVVPGEEDIKVRIKKPGDKESDDVNRMELAAPAASE